MLSGERRLLEWTDKNEDGTFTVKHLDVPVEMTNSFDPDSPHAGTMMAKWSEFIRPIHSMPYDKQGYMHGVEEAWYANGNKRVHAPREKGLNHGVIEFWDENGRSVLKGICKNDKAVGLWHEDKKALEDWVDHSDLPEEMTGPWFFYSDQQDLPIAHGTTPDKVMKQSVVQDYLAEKGISIERESGTYICRFDDKVLIAPVFIEELMLDREELVHALMDKADVPWFDTYAKDEPEPVQACALQPPTP